jgi:hypothetical protein
MFIGLLAMEPSTTTIRVCSGTHCGGPMKAIKKIHLAQYQFFVGHPNLIHGGCGATKRNIRLHFYNGISKEQVEQTYYPPIPETFNRKNQLANANSRRRKKVKCKKVLVQSHS